jgi:S-adenosylmethionine-diacylglycerol 3-amino-3-carboxypropyl transferase
VRLPVAFAQVREDALVDLAVVESLSRPAKILMVASGGCTAAALAASGNAASLHLVDPNPAQIALSRLKLELLVEADPNLRRAMLGHSAMLVGERKQRLLSMLGRLELPADRLGPIDFVAEVGPDYAGRYEQLFRALRAALGTHAPAVELLLHCSGTAEQRALAAAGTPIGQALDTALGQVMALPNLVNLFGSEATRNPAAPFDRHFAARIRHALGTLPAADNPWLWQMLLGRFPDSAAYPWLNAQRSKTLPPMTWECGFMQAALESRPGEFDFIHLSNILDWLSPERAVETLELTFKALNPGGCVLVRQLNSSLDIPALGGQFRWDAEGARVLHGRDRSFFYRALHWGFRR